MDITPKQKAKELFDKMKGFRILHSHSIKCAKVAVREILVELSPLDHHPIGSYINPKIEYWNEVLIELDNLKK